jgi:uncharacterized protein (TIGR03067 family)
MRQKLSVVIVVGLLVAAAGAEDKPAKGDKEKLQGTWALVSGEHDGQPIPEEVAKTIKLAFTGDKVTLHHNDQKNEGTFKLHSDKKPKGIDLDMENGAVKGIYQLDGDTLKLANAKPGDERPKEFPKKEGSGLTVATLKRQK